MRLNRGTLALLLGSVVIIAAVLIFNNSQVDAPTTDTTTTPTAEAGPLFAGLDAATLTRLEILEPSTGAKTVLTRTTFSEAQSVEIEQIETQEVVATDDAAAEATADTDVTAEAIETEESDEESATEATDEASETPEVTDESTEEATEEATVEVTDEVTEEPTEESAAPTATLDPLITPTVTLAPDASVWAISEATTLSEMGPDFTQAENAVAVFAALQSATRFSDVELTSFGLDNPRYTLIGTDASGGTYRVDIGVKNPTQPRYYAIINEDVSTVYQIPSDMVDVLTNLVSNPPYLPTSTPTPMPTITPNPYSEVQQTQTAEFELTQFAATMDVLTLAAPFAATPQVTPAAP